MATRRALPQPWTPQQDVDQALAYSDPVQQNRALINESRNQRTNVMALPEWADYDAVLKGRGVTGFGVPEEAIEQLPAGYTQDQLDKENATALQGGPAPRWTESENLPGSQRTISASLRGLRGLMKGQR